MFKKILSSPDFLANFNSGFGNFMRQQFLQSISDYRWFLEKGYPQKSSLQMVVTRYSLSSVERSMLFRGIMKKDVALERSKKILHIDEIKDQVIHIDAFNVVYTIASYLNGDTVYVSDDGMLRDASEIHGKEIRRDLIERSMKLCIGCLENLSARQFIFYTDELRPGVQVIKSMMPYESIFEERRYNLFNTLSADHRLKILQGIICATSDTDIIDSEDHKIFDLSRHILELNFSPDFLNLNKF